VVVTIDANADAARPAAATDRFARWVVALFFVAAFFPGEFNVGVNLPPYRLLLIVLVVPMLLRFRNDPTLRINAVDVFVFLAIFWRSLAIVVNHQLDQALNAISSFVDLFFAYMLGRVFVRNAEDHRFFFRCFLLLLLAFLPFALVENLFRQRLLRDLAGIVLNQSGGIADFGNAVRFGLLRAMRHSLRQRLFHLLATISEKPRLHRLRGLRHPDRCLGVLDPDALHPVGDDRLRAPFPGDLVPLDFRFLRRCLRLVRA
jgi:hypothetical protein